MKYARRKTHGGDTLYVRGGVADCKIKDRGRVIKKIQGMLSPKILGRGKGDTKCKSGEYSIDYKARQKKGRLSNGVSHD